MAHRYPIRDDNQRGRRPTVSPEHAEAINRHFGYEPDRPITTLMLEGYLDRMLEKIAWQEEALDVTVDPRHQAAINSFFDRAPSEPVSSHILTSYIDAILETSDLRKHVIDAMEITRTLYEEQIEILTSHKADLEAQLSLARSSLRQWQADAVIASAAALKTACLALAADNADLLILSAAEMAALREALQPFEKLTTIRGDVG